MKSARGCVSRQTTCAPALILYFDEDVYLLIGEATNSCINFQEAIREAGFEPQLRTQQYEWRELPTVIEEQVVDY